MQQRDRRGPIAPFGGGRCGPRGRSSGGSSRRLRGRSGAGAGAGWGRRRSGRRRPPPAAALLNDAAAAAAATMTFEGEAQRSVGTAATGCGGCKTRGGGGVVTSGQAKASGLGHEAGVRRRGIGRGEGAGFRCASSRRGEREGAGRASRAKVRWHA
jgi:hypothetical protein